MKQTFTKLTAVLSLSLLSNLLQAQTLVSTTPNPSCGTGYYTVVLSGLDPSQQYVYAVDPSSTTSMPNTGSMASIDASGNATINCAKAGTTAFNYIQPEINPIAYPADADPISGNVVRDPGCTNPIPFLCNVQVTPPPITSTLTYFDPNFIGFGGFTFVDNPLNPGYVSYDPTFGYEIQYFDNFCGCIMGNYSNTIIFTDGSGNIVIPDPLTLVPNSGTGGGAMGNVVTMSIPQPPTYISPINYISPALNLSSPLQVKLVSFTITTINNTNEIAWQTMDEKNNKQFELEKSMDANNFVNIATIASKQENSSTNNYLYVDNNINAPQNYYRLKIIAIDGKFEYSPIISNANSLDKIQLINTITNSSLQVVSVKNIVATILDLQGNTIQKVYLQQGLNTINVNNLTNGMYILSTSFNKLKFCKID